MKNTTAIVAGVTAMFCVTIAGAVVLAVLTPEQAGTTIGLILAALSSTVVGVLALAKIGSVERTVDDLANGKMDAKIRAGIADVLPEHLIDHKARPQLEQDRRRRDERARS